MGGILPGDGLAHVHGIDIFIEHVENMNIYIDISCLTPLSPATRFLFCLQRSS